MSVHQVRWISANQKPPDADLIVDPLARTGSEFYGCGVFFPFRAHKKPSKKTSTYHIATSGINPMISLFAGTKAMWLMLLQIVPNESRELQVSAKTPVIGNSSNARLYSVPAADQGYRQQRRCSLVGFLHLFLFFYLLCPMSNNSARSTHALRSPMVPFTELLHNWSRVSCRCSIDRRYFGIRHASQ